MLASGHALGFSVGWPRALRRGLIVVYSSASDVKSFHVCFHYGIVLAEFIRAFLSFFLVACGGGVPFCDGLSCNE